MDNLANINWLIVVPVGLSGLFFLLLSLRRGSQFFDHNSEASQAERFRDLFLSEFDACAGIFCLLIIMSPKDLLFVVIPIGLGLFILVPVLMLNGYYRLYVVSHFMPKNAGIKISGLNEKPHEKIPWYEFTPFAFILGWLMFFLVEIAARITGSVQTLNGLSTIIGVVVGMIAGVIVTLVAFLKSRAG